MEWKDHLITTSVDRLLEYLAEEKSASVSQAAKDLDVSEEMIEVWASALTDADMVTKSYSARRGTVLEIADTKKAREKMEEVREETEDELEKASEEIDDEHEEIQAARERLKEIADDLEQRLEADRRLEEDIEALQEEETELADAEDERTQELLTLLHSIEDDMASIDELDQELEAFRERRETIASNLKALEKLEQHIEQRTDSGHQCDDCGRRFDTEKGLKIHRSQKHKQSDSLLQRIKQRLGVRRKGD